MVRARLEQSSLSHLEVPVFPAPPPPWVALVWGGDAALVYSPLWEAPAQVMLQAQVTLALAVQGPSQPLAMVSGNGCVCKCWILSAQAKTLTNWINILLPTAQFISTIKGLT